MLWAIERLKLATPFFSFFRRTGVSSRGASNSERSLVPSISPFLMLWAIERLKLATPFFSFVARARQVEDGSLLCPVLLALSRGRVRQGQISCACNFDVLGALGHRALKLVAAPNGSHCNLEAVGCSFPKGLCANHLEMLLR